MPYLSHLFTFFDCRSDRSTTEHLLLLGGEDVRSGADDPSGDVKEPYTKNHTTSSVAEQFRQFYVLRSPAGKRGFILQLISQNSYAYYSPSQLNVTIFAFSSYDLLFNLYPLKAGWQPLPELQLDYVSQAAATATAAATSINSGPQSGKGTPIPGVMVNSSDAATSNTQPSGVDSSDSTGSDGLEAKRKAELDSLVKRWMPKMVFIHVSMDCWLILGGGKHNRFFH